MGRLKAEGLRLEGIERRRWLDVMQAGKSVLNPLVLAGENFGVQPKAFSLKPGFAFSLKLAATFIAGIKKGDPSLPEPRSPQIHPLVI